MNKYRAKTTIQAIRLDLPEMSPLQFVKWGNQQTANRLDWLAYNQVTGDTYTINSDTFSETYQSVDECTFRKRDVYAERATAAGKISTKEGFTDYAAGDWLVYNQPDRGDGYAMTPERFEKLYEAIEAY